MSAKAFCVEFVWGFEFVWDLNLWACRFERGKGLEFRLGLIRFCKGAMTS